MFQKILQLKLKFLAKLYLFRFKPMIIGVTGNAGKSSTKEAIGAVVSAHNRVRISGGNLNNEIGLPLTILGSWDREYYEQGPSLWFWFRVLWLSFIKLFGPQDYPEVLVLEYGADHPGDIKRLAQSYRPHISVVTTVGDVPVHVEFFENADAVAAEKSNLVSVLGTKDFAILNHDDPRVIAMKSKTKAVLKTYGFNAGSDIRASDVEYLSNEEGQPTGMTFKLNEGHHFVPVRIEGSLGKSQAWSAAAAAAVGKALGMNLVQISEAIRNYHSLKGRLKIISGVRNSNIIDDTYNASPASTRLALETLCDVPALRKIAVLGDMLELGQHSESAHREIGQFAAEVADVIVCSGPQAKVIGQAAREKSPEKTILEFPNSTEAKAKVKELIQEHDLILVKGSQGARMEKIVKEIMADPSQSKNLLVRQSRRWLAK